MDINLIYLKGPKGRDREPGELETCGYLDPRMVFMCMTKRISKEAFRNHNVA